MVRIRMGYVLEFCQMILETARYDSLDISCYTPLIESSLSFFDEHYRQLALQRGRKDLDGSGKLVIYPGSACETYKMATIHPQPLLHCALFYKLIGVNRICWHVFLRFLCA